MTYYVACLHNNEGEVTTKIIVAKVFSRLYVMEYKEYNDLPMTDQSYFPKLVNSHITYDHNNIVSMSDVSGSFASAPNTKVRIRPYLFGDNIVKIHEFSSVNAYPFEVYYDVAISMPYKGENKELSINLKGVEITMSSQYD
jgi:hypothetical protein